MQEVTDISAQSDPKGDTGQSGPDESQEAPRASSPDPEDAPTAEATPPPSSEDAKQTAPEAPEPAPTEEREPPTARQLAFGRIVEAQKEKTPVEGKVIGWNRGGFHISLDGLAAFCPRSMMEIGNPRNPADYLDQTFAFRVAEVDTKARRIVVSRQEVLRQERETERKEVRDRLQLHATVEGRIDSLADFGAFVALGGGIKGLIHLSEISRKRIDHPKEALKVGDEIQAKVIKLEKGGDRVSLSLRELEPDPWEGLDQKFARGATFTGTITRHSDFGLFVEVLDGIEGLVHSSQLAIGKSMSDAGLAEGETIEGWVREIEPSRHRLSLTMREVPEGDPWEGISKRYEEGSTIEAKVEQAARFGFFVELEPDLTGLLPFSALSAPQGRRKEQAYRAGQKISVQIMELDAKRKRISLGLKGSAAEGTSSDVRSYQKEQRGEESTGMGALAAAFEKLKQNSS